VGKRSIAVAVLVAAGLSVTTTGAASAGEPDDDRGLVIVTCEDGELVMREPTEEDRERLRALPALPARPRVEVEEGRRYRVEPDDGPTRVRPDGGVIEVVPAEPGGAAGDVRCRRSDGAAARRPGRTGGAPAAALTPA
jgi:hypothetical protein